MQIIAFLKIKWQHFLAKLEWKSEDLEPLLALGEPYLRLNENLGDYNNNKERLQNVNSKFFNSRCGWWAKVAIIAFFIVPNSIVEYSDVLCWTD